MTRRRQFIRATAGLGAAGLAGCPAADDESTPTATGTDTETATPEPVEAPAPVWTAAAKHGIATVPDHGSDDPSRVWATFTRGAVTEIRYPRVDLMHLRTLEFLVTDGERAWRTYDADTTEDDGVERSTVPATDEALVYEQTTRAEAWSLTVEWVADPARDALVGRVEFDAPDGYDCYAVARTACSNSAGTDVGRRTAGPDGPELAAWDGPGNDGQHVFTDDDGPFAVALGLAAAGGFDRASALSAGEGYALLSDGRWTDRDRVEGVVALAGQLFSGGGTTALALGFARDRDGKTARETARTAVAEGYDRVRESYVSAWGDYLDLVAVPDAVDGELATQYRVAAMTLAAVEDKTYLGAGIASPSVPWGPGTGATTPSDYGYNFVWARDLYQSFTALRAMGDVDGARRAAEYVFERQQGDDGFVPQNTYVDGTVRWGGEQLDEIAFPLVMAYQLTDRHDLALRDLAFGYADVAASADYVATGGPVTEQERWEEEGGYSPSTIAAEIAGLTCAAALAADAGERADALIWQATADEWADRVEDWCATTTGTDEHTRTPYYVRINDDTDPDDGAERSLANGGPTLDERNVVDAGFLELVRLGIKPADDPTIENSVAVVDDAIRVETPNGPAWYRYTGDGYGEPADGGPWRGEGQGRLWPIFTGERAEYELRREDSGDEPAALLDAMAAFANEGRMIPEQVWDRPEPTDYGHEFGEGTGSATPLSWSMAGYVRLAHSLDAGRPVETPAAVADRYGTDRERPALSVTDLPTRTEASPLSVAVSTDADEVLVRAGDETRTAAVEGGEATVEIPLSGIRNTVTVVAVADPDAGLDTGLAVDRQSVTYAG